MRLFEKEKRKNDSSVPRRLWRAVLLLVVGIVIIIIGSSIFFGGRYSSNSNIAISDDPFYITATYIIVQATQTAEAAHSSLLPP